MKHIKQILRSYWPLLLIIVVSGIMFFARSGWDLLSDWDECLYGQYAKEMPRTGNFLSNIWNGNIDLQKPPLYTWFLQIPRVFSTNEFALRTLSVFASLGLLIAVYVFAKKYFSTLTAIIADFLLLASELFVIYSTKLNTDIFFTLFIFLGFWCWIISFKKHKYSYFSGLLLGLAVMVKGLGSLQFLAAMFVSVFLNFKKERFMNFIKAVSVFFIVILPWHLTAYLKYGQEFVRVYFLENIVRRSQHAIENHREHWYFYFVLIYRELFPWIFFSIVLPTIYLFDIKKYFSFAAIKKELKDKEVIFSVILFFLIPLVAITRVKTKIAWYALPLYPFIAIFLAYNIELFVKKIKLRQVVYLILFVLILDAGRLMIHENRFLEKVEKPSARNEALLQTKKYSQSSLEYLVPFGERQGRAVLPPDEQISQTWVFGGNPCAVYYSNKKVHYYYVTAEFEQRLKKKDGLFLVENGDLHFIEPLHPKILFKNTDFTLFTF